MKTQLTPEEEQKFLDWLAQREPKENHSIVLFNDNDHSFKQVIEGLMMYCNHDIYQAEQCATIVHHNGKCEIKSGEFEDLVPIRDALNGVMKFKVKIV